jgi:hypothetical protein
MYMWYKKSGRKVRRHQSFDFRFSIFDFRFWRRPHGSIRGLEDFRFSIDSTDKSGGLRIFDFRFSIFDFRFWRRPHGSIRGLEDFRFSIDSTDKSGAMPKQKGRELTLYPFIALK